MDASFWRRCNTCKQEIPFAVTYYVCSVSTCHRKGTDFAFCSVPCWDAHVPLFRHRDSWAEERRSPSKGDWQRSVEAEKSSAQSAPARPVAPAPARSSAPPPARTFTPAIERPTPPPAATAESGSSSGSPQNPLSGRDPTPNEVLVVASKLKAYIRNRSGMNTSDGVLAVLSDRLRELCDDAILRAAESGRKTVLDRDF